MFTGQVPFHPSLPQAAMFDILIKGRPARPTHPQCTDELWEVMTACWDHSPLCRPEISTVLTIFRISSVFLPSNGRPPAYLIPRGSLLDSTDSETTESLESLLPDKAHEQTSGTGKSQSANQGENSSHNREVRGRGLTSLDLLPWVPELYE